MGTLTDIRIIGCGAQAKYAEEICNILNIKIIHIYSYGDIKTFPNKRPKKFEIKYVIDKDVVFCFSDISLKKELYDILSCHCYFPSLIHPSAIIASTAEIGEGCIINPGAIIQPYTKIGNFTMIHSGSIIEHDCNIGDFCNIAPGVILAGWVVMGEGSTIYSNTTVIPTMKIGANSIIGANSLILDHIEDNSKSYGIVTKRGM